MPKVPKMVVPLRSVFKKLASDNSSKESKKSAAEYGCLS